ncbi:uncharacterized protein FOMMEDRAFT_150249 [Fomitiporia mediterranea MF3/22]|uniref:uncharacterized protein n=1 Tax=Fomitiporia mediterranea (strain MF3/22) TaxID=694068 RepID=UPI0004407EB3|nr:uncharacterized protein FOMMEDRAFT_150249 [Fomitiporia mediterranea MF3/22]EJD07707.1 hypothetical protein FOMMEDRAFT_150249 [Fomitiporia mediterranea MF3/22]
MAAASKDRECRPGRVTITYLDTLCHPTLRFIIYNHNIQPSAAAMPVAPITGTLRKQFFTTLSLALGLGTAAGYGFWYGVHLPSVKRQEEFYLKLEKQRAEDA